MPQKPMSLFTLPMPLQTTFLCQNSKHKHFTRLKALFLTMPSFSSLGLVDSSTIEKVEVVITDAEKERLKRVENKPSLSEILNLHDFEAIAKLVMPEKAWAYYSSAADDEITNRENHMAYHRYVLTLSDILSCIETGYRIWFRPQILVDVEKVDFSTRILGQKSTMPIYIVEFPPQSA